MRGIRTLPTAPQTSVLRGVVVAIAVLQSAMLGLLARRGSWMSDDLDFLVQGSRGFAPAELLTPVNDHIAPGLRFVYAVFAAVAPFDHDFTVGWRVVMQAIAIVLMGLLLLRILGSNWWVVAGTLFYALTPLSMPSFMSLSSGVNNLSAHVFCLLLLHATVDWSDGHRRRAVAYGPLSLLLTLACWEKSALILVTAVALALYLRTDPLRTWLRSTWLFAVALIAAIVAFGILYVSHGNPSAGHLPGPRVLLKSLAHGFAVPLGALVGGPWQWNTFSVMGTAHAPVAAVVLGGLVTALLLVTAWRRDPRALLFWGSVAVYVVVTVVLVAYGRFALLGDLLTSYYHYWSDLSIPLTLAVVLSLSTVQVRTFAVVPIAFLIAGVVVSDTGFAREWGKNPAKAYFATVTAELDRAGPNVNLWDTSMPSPIVNALMPDTRLSPVLRMAGIPFQLQSPSSEPLIVDQTGHLRPAQLAVWSRSELTKESNSFCNHLLHGTDTLVIPLAPTQSKVATANWFAKAAYFSNRENQVTVELLDAHGKVAAVPSGKWPAGLGTMYFGPSPLSKATAVRLRSSDPATNLCVQNLEIGLPR